MVCYTREKWRLGVNMILAEILAPMLYGISTSLYLPTFHRFVTNPTTVQNGTLVNEVGVAHAGGGNQDPHLFSQFAIVKSLAKHFHT